jgi:hypothetical protein
MLLLHYNSINQWVFISFMLCSITFSVLVLVTPHIQYINEEIRCPITNMLIFIMLWSIVSKLSIHHQKSVKVNFIALQIYSNGIIHIIVHCIKTTYLAIWFCSADNIYWWCIGSVLVPLSMRREILGTTYHHLRDEYSSDNQYCTVNTPIAHRELA